MHPMIKKETFYIAPALPDPVRAREAALKAIRDRLEKAKNIGVFPKPRR